MYEVLGSWGFWTESGDCVTCILFNDADVRYSISSLGFPSPKVTLVNATSCVLTHSTALMSQHDANLYYTLLYIAWLDSSNGIGTCNRTRLTLCAPDHRPPRCTGYSYDVL
ncbi:hypothetical protein RSAG8_01745, partial [Rhizoctonia solani AG-8 WAC10335]